MKGRCACYCETCWHPTAKCKCPDGPTIATPSAECPEHF